MKFGTDGFRGRADESVTPDFCLKLGFHTGTIIKKKGYDSIILRQRYKSFRLYA